MTEEDDFDWGEKGEAYWRDLGAQCKGSEQQIRFACARHGGASATGAARLAGYDPGNDPATIRQAGYKAIRTTAVAAMLALANAEDEPATTATKVMDKAGRTAKLSAIAHKSPRSDFANQSDRGDEQNGVAPAALSQTDDTDALGEDRMIRNLLQLPGGAAAAVCLQMGKGTAISRIALLHDVHTACMADPVSRVVWDMAVRKCTPTMQRDLRELLARPDWQLATREQLWREVDVDPATPDKAIPIDWSHEWVPQLKNHDTTIHSNINGATQ